MSRQIPKQERRLWMRLRSRYDLIAHMTQRGLSVAELARWSHCHKSMIGHLRSGQLSTCTPGLAARIEKALGVNPGDLFEVRSSTLMSETSSVQSNAGRARAGAA